MSAGLSPPLALGEPPGEEWGQGTAPQTCQTSAASCLHAFVYPQPGVNPAGTKKLLVPGRLGAGGGQVGSPVWLAQQEGDPPKQSLAPHTDTLPPVRFVSIFLTFFL